MSSASTVVDLLQRGDDAAVAISAPGSDPLTFSALRAHIAGTVTTLNRLGVGRNDPVAIVLPNGPQMASAFVAIAAGATTAPLNPAYQADEFEFYLSDLCANLLIVESGSDSPSSRRSRQTGDLRRGIDAEQRPGRLVSTHGRSCGGLTAGERKRHGRRHRAGTPHFRHYIAPKDRPLDPGQYLRDGGTCSRDTGPDSRGLLLECHAVVPHSWSHGGGVEFAGSGSLDLLFAGVQRAEVLRLDEGGQPELVYGCADDAPGNPGTRCSQP